MPLLTIEEPPQTPVRGFALWALGFRPFYLLASVFAALSIPLWALQFSGMLGHAYLSGPLWHAHEMVFGFTLAVIVGFLFTAGRNWSNLPTPTGSALAALAGLWLAARILVLTPFAWAAALANVAFPVAAAVALAIPFWKARNRRNYFFVGLLLMFGVAAGAFHLAQMGRVPSLGPLGIQVALDVVLFILAVMGGRVIPMFTNNGVPGANAMRQAGVEKASLGLLIGLTVADAARLPELAIATVAGVAGVAHLVRWLLWQPWKTGSKSLVWVLHLAYLWVPLHLGLRTLAGLGAVPPSAAVHALTVGAIGGLIIGMVTRTAKGHTGRPLRADAVDTSCYVLVLLAAVVRVVLPLASPELMLAAVLGSAALWSAGFGLYAIRYFPVLTRPRLDGKPG
ncbi:NnrS family protein [Caldimonas brevitalea]|uniref:NnrS family protein n=1 Tax=Caldimonas brevitalea TaxID=413882 RepID=A0A0G3BWI3_9BURK|nr:NnrS family protein [Caldimonas brevitalea]AKJ30885.1 NnrS family protein [Caldimonas brevitalea]